MNKVILFGNLTKKPDVRFTQNGSAYTHIAVAVTRQFSKSDKPETDFIDCTVWGKQAEFCGKYFDKGSKIMVEGRLQNSNYEDKNGVKHYSYSVFVEHIEFTGGKPQTRKQPEESGETYKTNEVDYPPPQDNFDDMPF